MPFCDQCGAENPDWARFCDQCGNPLASGAAPGNSQAAAPPDRSSGAGTPGFPTTCPQCGSAVIPGEAFCDNCGTPLLASAAGSNPPGGSIPPQQHYPAPQPVALPTTPVQPAPGGNIPGASPAPFSPTAQHPLAAAHLLLTARNVTLPLPAADQILLGRSDPVSGVYPDIDLTPYGGLESGVGRRHAHLRVQQGTVLVEDLNSTNGTYLNGQRLTPNAPQPIKSGDELRLGTLVLRMQL